MQLVYVPILTQPDAVGVTDQDCLPTLRDIRLVYNLACYPIPCLTITRCFLPCLIPTEIKFIMLCEKIDIVNKASPYIIKFISWVVTVLSFLCCCVIVAEFFFFFLGSSYDSSYSVKIPSS